MRYPKSSCLEIALSPSEHWIQLERYGRKREPSSFGRRSDASFPGFRVYRLYARFGHGVGEHVGYLSNGPVGRICQQNFGDFGTGIRVGSVDLCDHPSRLLVAVPRSHRQVRLSRCKFGSLDPFSVSRRRRSFAFRRRRGSGSLLASAPASGSGSRAAWAQPLPGEEDLVPPFRGEGDLLAGDFLPLLETRRSTSVCIFFLPETSWGR